MVSRSESGLNDTLITTPPRNKAVLTTIAAGIVVWLITLSLGVGFAAFAFNSAPTLISAGIAAQVLGSALVYIMSGVGSQAKELCWQASPIPSLYYGAFITLAVANCGGDLASLASTVHIFIMVSTLVLGVALFVCARFHAGKILEHFPDSVLTGYIGGIGTLIIRSALTLLSGVDPLDNIHDFCKANSLIHVAVGSLLGVVIFGMMRKFSHPATMVLPIFITVASFYMVILIFDIPLQSTRDSGWVFQNYGRFPFHRLWTDLNVISADLTFLVHSGLPLILQMALLSIVAQYSSSGAVLNEFTGSTVGVDHGTSIIGIGNIVVGCCGGMALAGGMAPSAVNAAIVGKGGANRWVHIICGCLHLVLFLSGFPLVSYLPKFALAGCLLLPIGAKMTWGALSTSLYTYGIGDYSCIVAVMVTTVVSNVQTALYVGIVFNSFVMLFSCAQMDIVYERSSLEEFRSMKDRTVEQRQLIEQNGKLVRVWRLHGVLFLGNCVALKRELATTLESDTRMRFMILDMGQVISVEHSVWAFILQLATKAKTLGRVRLILCGLNKNLKKQLAGCGSSARTLSIVRSLALAVEHAEDYILETVQTDVTSKLANGRSDSFIGFSQLSMALANQQASSKKNWSTEQLQFFFHEMFYHAMETVCLQRAPADKAYYVASGEFHLYQQASSGSGSELNLLRKMTRGSIFGAEALYGVPNYRATVDCKVTGLLVELPEKEFRRMTRDEPEMALDLMLLVGSGRFSLCWELLEHSFTPDRVFCERSGRRVSRAFTDDQDVMNTLSGREVSISRIGAFVERIGRSLKSLVYNCKRRFSEPEIHLSASDSSQTLNEMAAAGGEGEQSFNGEDDGEAPIEPPMSPKSRRRIYSLA